MSSWGNFAINAIARSPCSGLVDWLTGNQLGFRFLNVSDGCLTAISVIGCVLKPWVFCSRTG